MAKNGDKFYIALLVLRSELEIHNTKVKFNHKSTDRSKLTMKAITSHFLSDRFVIK
jgi:hypothetical protein